MKRGRGVVKEVTAVAWLLLVLVVAAAVLAETEGVEGGEVTGAVVAAEVVEVTGAADDVPASLRTELT